MPWDVKKDSRCPSSRPWAVVNADTDRLVACHPSRDHAVQQLRALYVNVPESRKAVAASDVRAYVLRHGVTALSPKPEDWADIPLNGRGRDDSHAGATFIRELTTHSAQWPKPDRIIPSKLARTIETAGIAANVLGIPVADHSDDLRAFNPHEETPQDFEARNERAFHNILGEPGVPLIVGHRSTTAFLDRRVRTQSADDWRPDYMTHTLLREGGVLAIKPHGLVALFRPVSNAVIGSTRLPPWIPYAGSQTR